MKMFKNAGVSYQFDYHYFDLWPKILGCVGEYDHVRVQGHSLIGRNHPSEELEVLVAKAGDADQQAQAARWSFWVWGDRAHAEDSRRASA